MLDGEPAARRGDEQAREEPAKRRLHAARALAGEDSVMPTPNRQ